MVGCEAGDGARDDRGGGSSEQGSGRPRFAREQVGGSDRRAGEAEQSGRSKREASAQVAHLVSVFPFLAPLDLITYSLTLIHLVARSSWTRSLVALTCAPLLTSSLASSSRLVSIGPSLSNHQDGHGRALVQSRPRQC